MKLLNSPGLIRYLLMIVFVIMGGFGSTVALATDTPPTFTPLAEPVKVGDISCRYRLAGPLPTSSTEDKFSPWKVMHPHTFDGKLGSYVAQCKATVGSLSWLTTEVCDAFGKALHEGRCVVVSDVNNIQLDVVRGKDKRGRSTAFLYEHMQLAEPRQAIFVSLPGDHWLGMFAGEQGKSCNNFFALRDEPPSPPAKAVLEPLPPPPPAGKWVCVNVPIGQVVHSTVGQHLDGFVLQNKCCCGNNTFVPSFNFQLGDTVDSGSGYTEKCFWVEPNQQPKGEVQ